MPHRSGGSVRDEADKSIGTFPAQGVAADLQAARAIAVLKLHADRLVIPLGKSNEKAGAERGQMELFHVLPNRTVRIT